jgi:hypothetical protein
MALGATFALFAVVGVGIASAQTTPAGAATTSSTASSTTVAQATPAPKPPALPLVVFHLTPIATWMVGGSDVARPPSKGGTTGNYQYVEPLANLGYGAQINVTRHWYLNYVHSYIDQNIAKVTTEPYQVLNNDRTDDASLNYVVNPSLSFAGGWHERVRQCCGNNAPASAANQTAYHYNYLQVAGHTGPGSKYFGKILNVTVQGQDIPHNTTPIIKDIHSEGNKTHVTATGNVTLPIGDPKTSTFAGFFTYLNQFDYFLNSPIMYLYNEADYGFIKKFSPWVTLTATNSNLYQHLQGYPYKIPDTINRNRLIVTLDIAIPYY